MQRQVSVQTKPVPVLDPDKDHDSVIVKVQLAGLCGSDIWVYQGFEECPSGVTQGHEFIGTIESKGRGVKHLEVGDRVVSPFTTSCGTCWYCTKEMTSRCLQSQLFGSENLPGGQAEYVKVPLADGTLYKLEDGMTDRIIPEALLLLADVAPTGLFGVEQALGHHALRSLKDIEKTIVVVGCGPVGLCAVAAALWRGATVFAIDDVPERRAWAEKLGARVIGPPEDAVRVIKQATEGRGADAAVEAVGRPAALTLAIECLRPHGVLTSVGVHQTVLPLHGQEVFNKNLHLSFGRCPARSLIPKAIQLLQAKDMSFLITHRVALKEADHYYGEFASHKTGKVLFDMSKR